MPHIQSSHFPFTSNGIHAGNAVRISPDELLAQRFPDLTMQLHDPAPSRRVYDQLMTDSSTRFEPHSIGERMVGETDREGQDGSHFSPRYAECRGKFDATLMSAYDQSPTFRRIFNHSGINRSDHGEDAFRLNALAALTDSESENTPRLREAQRTISLRVEAPHLEGVEAYMSERGEVELDWDRACLHMAIGALTDLSEDGEEDHLRGGVVEYTNIVLKEMGSELPACSQSLNCAVEERSRIQVTHFSSAEGRVEEHIAVDLPDLQETRTGRHVRFAPHPEVRTADSVSIDLAPFLERHMTRATPAGINATQNGQPDQTEDVQWRLHMQAQLDHLSTEVSLVKSLIVGQSQLIERLRQETAARFGYR